MSHVKHSRIVILVLFFWMLMLLAVLQFDFVKASYIAKSNQPDVRKVETETGLGGKNCRYGIATPFADPHAISWVPTTGAGWYLNFGANPQNVPDVEFVPIVRVKQDYVNGTYLPGYTTTPALSDTSGGLGVKIADNPGSLWLIGNEPDVANFVQDNTMPEKYAEIYHDVYHFIKERDPSAQVGIAGLSMATPGRLQYLDIVWNKYIELYGTTMDVDVWNVHIYILSEKRQSDGGNSDGKIALGTDPALAKLDALNATECPLPNVYCRAEHDDLSIFANQLIAFRTWMKEHGQQNKPLVLSEFSILYPFVDYDDEENPTQCFLMDEEGNCFTQSRISNYMNATTNWLDTAVDMNIGYPIDNYRLVQQWMWFSLYLAEPTDSGASSNLLRSNYGDYGSGDSNAYTQVGDAYVEKISSLPIDVNLIATNVQATIGQTEPPTTTSTITLTVEYFNNGNTSITQPFAVTFYSDQSLTQEIGSVNITPDVLGCARIKHTASVLWENLAPGKHDFWAVVDSNDDIVEPGSDNIVQGVALVDPETVYLPITTSSLP